MDGDVAPLDKIQAIAEAESILLMVDDAHGEGVLGHGGRGIVDHFDLHGKVDVEVGHAVESVWGDGRGGGRQQNHRRVAAPARPAVPVLIGPDRARHGRLPGGLDVLEDSTDLVDRLWENAKYFKAEMQGLGFDTGLSTTPITPIMLGEAPAGAGVQPGACSSTKCSPWPLASPPCRKARPASG